MVLGLLVAVFQQLKRISQPSQQLIAFIKINFYFSHVIILLQNKILNSTVQSS